MRTRTKVLLLSASIAFAALLLAILSRVTNSEPEYQNRTLSEWFDIRSKCVLAKDAGAITRSNDAVQAIREIGTNAIPIVLQWLCYEPSRLHNRMENLTFKLPVDFSLKRPIFAALDEDDKKAGQAVDFFIFVGPNAAPAIPELVRLINRTNSHTTFMRAAACLAAIGTNALPVIGNILGQTNSAAKSDVITSVALAHLFHRADWSSAAPLFIHYAKAGDGKEERACVIALGAIGRDQPDICIPLLTNKLNSTNEIMRSVAVMALGYFGARAAPAIPNLLPMLNDPDKRVRDRVTNTLSKIAPETFTNVPPR